MKQKENKATYVAPNIEIIEMENEGVIASSNNIPGFGNGGNIGGRSVSRNRSYNPVVGGELEDMIDNILTIEN